MILSGQAILDAQIKGDIFIDPFDSKQLNPNSYNYRLSDSLIVIRRDQSGYQILSERIHLPSVGYVLQPGTLYLGATYEIIGSTRYVTTLLGRSSIGRLGLYLNITADLGHTGSISRWTLELEVVQPLRIYPLMKIGQAAFWVEYGTKFPYSGRYQSDLAPIENRDIRLEKRLPQP
jgi:dCTP deaminase